MSDLAVLSDAELDAVSGGFSLTITGGNGGNGGTATNALVAENWIGFSKVSVDVYKSSANANGGNGGAGVVVPVFI